MSAAIILIGGARYPITLHGGLKWIPSGILITERLAGVSGFTKAGDTEVCHASLRDPAFFRFLQRIDEEFAAETRREGFCLYWSDDYLVNRVAARRRY